MTDPKQRAAVWLQQQGAVVEQLFLLSGYTNHVFLVKQSAPALPRRSVLRLADAAVSAELCPLAHQFDDVVRKHRDAFELGLAPEVLVADRAEGVMWLAYAGCQKTLGLSGCADLSKSLQGLHRSGLDWQGNESFSLRRFLKGLLKSKIPSFSPKQRLQNKTFESKGSAFQQKQEVNGEPPPLKKGERGGFKAVTNCSVRGDEIDFVQILLQQAQQRGYFDYPVVPVHGDLNPGNLLHDGQRWWLIDWDFASMQPREWDVAGLVVEHGWTIEQAQAFAPDIALADLKWFCRCCALLSESWHVQRGSASQVIAKKSETMHYWITLKG